MEVPPNPQDSHRGRGTRTQAIVSRRTNWVRSRGSADRQCHQVVDGLWVVSPWFYPRFGSYPSHDLHRYSLMFHRTSKYLLPIRSLLPLYDHSTVANGPTHIRTANIWSREWSQNRSSPLSAQLYVPIQLVSSRTYVLANNTNSIGTHLTSG